MKKASADFLWRVVGKQKTSGTQRAEGKTGEKGTMRVNQANADCLRRVQGKEKTSGSQ